MSENKICPICGGLIGRVHAINAVYHERLEDEPRICPGHETTDAEIANHFAIIGNGHPELVYVPKGWSVYPNFLQQEEVFWEIAKEVAEENYKVGSDLLCPFCDQQFIHSSDCIVIKARKLIKQRKAQPQMDIKFHTIADETTVASALIHQKEPMHQPSPLRQMAEEARRQEASGETEEGGFAIEEGEL